MPYAGLGTRNGWCVNYRANAVRVRRVYQFRRAYGGAEQRIFKVCRPAVGLRDIIKGCCLCKVFLIATQKGAVKAFLLVLCAIV